MREFFKTAGLLAGICFVASLLLAITAGLTSEPIRKTNQEKKDQARRQVLSADLYENKILPPPSELEVLKGDFTIQTGLEHFSVKSEVGTNYSLALDSDGRLLGYIFEVLSPGGYGGKMEIVVGIALDPELGLRVSDYLVIASQETPGLGKAVEASLHQVFTNSKRSLGLTNLNPEDKTDCVSGATITSLAIKDASYAGLKLASLLEERNRVNLELADYQLALIPYSQDFQTLEIPQHEGVREALEVSWYGGVSGYLLKIFIRDDETHKKYLGLAGFIAGDERLFQARLFEIPISTNEGFNPVEGFNEGLFFQAELSTLTNNPLTKLETELAIGIIEGREILNQAGRF